MQGLACQKAPQEGWGLATSLLMDSAEVPLWSLHDRCVHVCLRAAAVCMTAVPMTTLLMASVPVTSVPMTVCLTTIL